MRLRLVPAESRCRDRSRQYGLPVGDAGQGHGVEHAERVERIALVLGARDRGIDESQIEMRVVADQDRALAVVVAHRVAYVREDVVQRIVFGLGEPKRMMDVDAGHLERLRIDRGAIRRLDMRVDRASGHQAPVVVQIQRDRGDLQQCMATGFEAAGFDIDDDRQEAAEAAGHRNGGKRRLGGCCSFAHARKPSRAALRGPGTTGRLPCPGCWIGTEIPPHDPMMRRIPAARCRRDRRRFARAAGIPTTACGALPVAFRSDAGRRVGQRRDHDTVLVKSRFSRAGSGSSPLTWNQMFSAMLVAWSPMRSMFLAMNNRWVLGVIARGSSIM